MPRELTESERAILLAFLAYLETHWYGICEDMPGELSHHAIWGCAHHAAETWLAAFCADERVPSGYLNSNPFAHFR